MHILATPIFNAAHVARLRCKQSLCMVTKLARIVNPTLWNAARETLVLPITIWHWGIKDHKCLGEGSLLAKKLPVGKLSPNR